MLHVGMASDACQAQGELASCVEREENERLELAHLERLKRELDTQMEAEQKRKEEELEPKIQQLRANNQEVREEISHQKALVEKYEREKKELVDRYDKMNRDRIELDNQILNSKLEMGKIKSEPEKHRFVWHVFSSDVISKQADVVQTALQTLKTQVDKLGTHLVELDNELNNHTKKKKVSCHRPFLISVTGGCRPSLSALRCPGQPSQCHRLEGERMSSHHQGL